jgi:hypothetical protein
MSEVERVLGEPVGHVDRGAAPHRHVLRQVDTRARSKPVTDEGGKRRVVTATGEERTESDGGCAHRARDVHPISRGRTGAQDRPPEESCERGGVERELRAPRKVAADDLRAQAVGGSPSAVEKRVERVVVDPCWE